MKAKDFLLQIKKLDKLIENKLIEIQQLKDIADSTSGNLTGDKVQSTSNPHRFAETIAQYIDLENEIKTDIDRLIDIRKDVISVIEQLNATEYDILHKLYVQNITFQDVASIYDRTYGWATTIHGRALKNLQKILDEREEKSES